MRTRERLWRCWLNFPRFSRFATGLKSHSPSPATSPMSGFERRHKYSGAVLFYEQLFYCAWSGFQQVSHAVKFPLVSFGQPRIMSGLFVIVQYLSVDDGAQFVNLGVSLYECDRFADFVATFLTCDSFLKDRRRSSQLINHCPRIPLFKC